MKKICIIAFLSLLCCVSTTATAQVGIKTNLLGWATASPGTGMGLWPEIHVERFRFVQPV